MALDPHLAVHHLGQAARDRQTKPGAAIFASGGGIGLLEAAEQSRLLLLAESYAGIMHRKVEQQAIAATLGEADLEADIPLLGELDGIAHVVDQDLAESQFVTDQLIGNIRRYVDDELQSLLVGLFGGQIDQVIEQIIEGEGLRIERQLAGLNLGKVEDIVDDAEQMTPRALDLVDKSLLAAIQRRFLQQVGQAEDGVERGSDLVAHVGQEVGFDACRLLGQLFGIGQFGFGLFLRVDIDKGADQPAGQAVRLAEAGDPVQGLVNGAVGKGDRHLPLGGADLADDALILLLILDPVSLRQVVEIQHPFADERLGIDAEDFAVGSIEASKSAVGILEEQRIGDGVHQNALEGELIGQRLLGFLLVGDIQPVAIPDLSAGVELGDLGPGLNPAQLAAVILDPVQQLPRGATGGLFADHLAQCFAIAGEDFIPADLRVAHQLLGGAPPDLVGPTADETKVGLQSLGALVAKHGAGQRFGHIGDQSP